VVACPGGSVSTRVDGATVTIAGGMYKVEVQGQTLNDTTGGIKFEVTVPVTAGGRTDQVRPDQFGQTIAAGATLKWTLTKLVESTSQPTIGSPSGNWSWADPKHASCPTSAFG
jgi:hypothetical protein